MWRRVDILACLACEERMIELLHRTVLSFRMGGSNCGGEEIVLGPLEMSSRFYTDWSVQHSRLPDSVGSHTAHSRD